MKIGIIGGGSIGLLFAFYLSEEYEVTIYTNTFEQADAIKKNGILLKHKNNEQTRFVNSNWIKQWSGQEDLTIIAVKQYHLEDLISKLKEQQIKKTNYIFLQNGMGHLKFLKELNADVIFVSSVDHGAYRESFHSVLHNGIGQAKLAQYKGEFDLPQAFFSIPNFSIVMEKDYFEMLLKKLVANSVINSLTAVLRVTNGEIINNPHYFCNVQNLFNEIEEILQLKQGEIYFNEVINICHKTSSNRSSMLKDLESKRPTEVDAILGYILEEAEVKNVKAPICQTLYHIIKGSEK
ncbi:2-dehydropantoate 2-reductase [Bacillus sp. CGMCC 1.16607]|uniref:2-dehydropantoate 2-reductase n=1 Tax=Bacillus sp. CGMCC 1.16607 TaxID=3351842 RepID=UPI003631C121